MGEIKTEAREPSAKCKAMEKETNSKRTPNKQTNIHGVIMKRVSNGNKQMKHRVQKTNS